MREKMNLDLVLILADAIKGYFEESELIELCNLYEIDLDFEGVSPAYMRFSRDLIVGIGDPSKRRFLKTIIQSLLNRAREGAGKTKWDRQEYHRSMVDNLIEMQNEFDKIISNLNESERYEQVLSTVEEIASLLRTDTKTVLSILESGELDGFKIGNDWRIRTDSIIEFLRDQITNQRMRSLAHNLQKPEVWKKELQNFPALKKQLTETDFDEGSMGAFLKSLIDDNEYKKDTNTTSTFHPSNLSNHSEVKPMPDPKKVFVVHGRDNRLRKEFFSFLRALGLQPIEWSEALKLTGKATPYIGETLESAFKNAQAVIVLLSPDDEVRLSPELWKNNEDNNEKEFRHQARPNVLFEAGMAFGTHQRRTLLVEVGQLKAFSDVAGRHVVRLSDSSESRNEIAERLITAGCVVSKSGSDWLETGDFSVIRKKKIEPFISSEKDLNEEELYEAYGCYWNNDIKKRCLRCKSPLKSSSPNLPPSVFFCSNCNCKHALEDPDGNPLTDNQASELVELELKGKQPMT
jgi:excisionase family DNA binding protein